MTLLTRVMDKTKTTFQEWMDRIDDPAASADQAIAGLEEEIGDVERTAAYMMGTERDLLGQLEDAAFLSGELGLRAAQAAEEGREFVARQMFEEKEHYDAVIAEVRIRYQDTRERVRGLVQKLYDMKEQLYTLKKRHAAQQK